MTAFLSKALPRRALFQALLAVPAFSLLRDLAPPPAPLPVLDDDAIVEIGGWILKRSDVA